MHVIYRDRELSVLHSRVFWTAVVLGELIRGSTPRVAERGHFWEGHSIHVLSDNTSMKYVKQRSHDAINPQSLSVITGLHT